MEKPTMARILVIEDDVAVRTVIRKMLVKKGHEVVEASDGAEGIKLFWETPAKLIITDILMPNKEGIVTIMELRRDFPDVKIIAISGGGAIRSRDYLSLAENIGATRTLSKPFKSKELIGVVEELLSE